MCRLAGDSCPPLWSTKNYLRENNMKRISICLICWMLCAAACEDSVVGPEPETSPESFSVSYTADPSRAVSVEIEAATGGTVTAIDAGGVSFRLDIPPGALAADTTVTVTPLSSLMFTGPGSGACPGCGADDSTCCHRGALFEPSGIEFDEPATLTIGFPAGEPFPFDTLGMIVLFDPPRNGYCACCTELDEGGKTLTTPIYHFTGYGADNPDCCRLWGIYSEINHTILGIWEHGPCDLFTYCFSLEQLLGLRASIQTCEPGGGGAQCRPMCGDLEENIDAAINESLPLYCGRIDEEYPAAEATITTTGDAVRFFDCLWRLGSRDPLNRVGPAASGLLPHIRQMATTLVQTAREECRQYHCDEGKAILRFVRELCTSGYIDDPAFLADVEKLYDDCCGAQNLTLSIDKSMILWYVTSEADEPMAYATITATLTTSTGEPVEGQYVSMGYDHYLFNVGDGRTDENGELRVLITGGKVGDALSSCLQHVNLTIQAKSYSDELHEYVYSNELTSTFVNPVVTTTVDYSYTYEYYDDSEHYGNASATISGTGWTYAPPGFSCPISCDGQITRSYHSDGCSISGCSECDLIGGETLTGCISTPKTEGYLTGNGIRLTRLTGVSVGWYNLRDNATLRYCEEGSECDTLVKTLNVPWPQPWDDFPSFLPVSVGGSIEPATWSYHMGDATASLYISAAVSY